MTFYDFHTNFKGFCSLENDFLQFYDFPPFLWDTPVIIFHLACQRTHISSVASEKKGHKIYTNKQSWSIVNT